VYQVPSGAELTSVRFDLPVSLFALSPTGKTFALVPFGGDGGVIHFHDTATFQERHRIRAHAQPIRVLTFSADGTRIASGSDDATVRVWPVPDLR
jgi:WD40 repeat protein